MLAALENARRHQSEPGAARVFLTALGGGAFGNNRAWITGAMRRAFERFRGIGLQVVIVSFSKPWAAAKPLLGDWFKSLRRVFMQSYMVDAR